MGNGIVKDGRFCMLVNEYDLSTRYYKIFRAEEKIRSWAQIFPNSYHVALFDASRHIYNKGKMTNQIPLYDLRKITELR